MFPSPEALCSLYDFLRWADGLMIDAASELPEADYFAPRGFSLGSVHKLLVHTMAAQQAWLSRWRGVNPTRLVDDTDHPTRDSLARHWPLVHDDLRTFLDAQTAETLAAPLAYSNLAGQPFTLPLGGQMYHLVDHSAYHRGQINSMIRMAGGQPALASYPLYLASRDGRP